MFRSQLGHRLFCMSLILLAAAALPARAQDGHPAGGPSNDECRFPITVSNGDTNFTNVGASIDGVEEFPLCNDAAYANIYNDVWYRYIATCSGELKVNLCDSDFDTKVAVYDGCVCPAPSPPLGCNDDSPTEACRPQSELTVPVEQGSCYTIRVGGYVGQSGSGVMNLSCNVIIPMGACCNAAGGCLGTLSESACDALNGIWNQGQNCSSFVCPIDPPVNDACSNGVPLTTGVAYDSTTLGATGSLVTCGTNDTKDVWHSWTATCSGRARITTCGSGFDTTLAVYNSCNGGQLACNDDGCTASGQFSRSLVNVDVVEGATYQIRVAGANNATGSYRVLVDTCRNACCINGGFKCQVVLESQCLGGGGIPGGDGTLCAGDTNGNGINDACEDGCPAATIVGADPPSGTVDARQPHPMNFPALRQGIGSPGVPGVLAEPIHVQLNPAVAGAEGCFSLCETVADPLGPNGINSVVYHGSGEYEITLNRAIAMGAVTTIEYTGDGSFVQYTSHPANANSDSAAAPGDIIHLIDHLNGARVPPLTIYQCDFDRSAICGPADIITLIDLLNGAGAFDVWNQTPLPTNSSCP